MYVNRTKKNPYTKQMVFDVLSAVVGLAVIVVGIVSFIDPEENAWMFPIVFLRMTGGYGRGSGRRKALGIGLFFIAGVLLILSVVGALCLWR